MKTIIKFFVLLYLNIVNYFKKQKEVTERYYSAEDLKPKPVKVLDKLRQPINPNPKPNNRKVTRGRRIQEVKYQDGSSRFILHTI
jgi:hypothetical protein